MAIPTMAVRLCTNVVHDVAVQYGMVLAWANTHNGSKGLHQYGALCGCEGFEGEGDRKWNIPHYEIDR